MKWSKGIIFALSAMMLLAGCGSKDNSGSSDQIKVKPIEEGDYETILGQESNQARILNNKSSGSMFDVYEIGKGLQELAKAHFSADSYQVQEGQLLTYSSLAASQNGLLGNQSDDNKTGLNPKVGEAFDLGNGDTTDDPFILTGIQEIDFLQNGDLSGVAIAMVMRQEWYEDHESGLYQVKKEMTDEKFRLFGEEAARKLVNNLRALPEVGDEMPIYVALYNANSADDTLPGHYFAEGYFVSRSTNFEDIDEQWYIFPSDAGSEIDSVTAGRMDTLKASLYDQLPENIGVVGKGKYVDKELRQLHITITMDAKTYVECSAIVHYTLSLMKDFNQDDYAIKIEVYSNKDLIATMVRAENESDFTTHLML